jgi:hypothetical protein
MYSIDIKKPLVINKEGVLSANQYFFPTNVVIFKPKNWEVFGIFFSPNVNWNNFVKLLELFAKFSISQN